MKQTAKKQHSMVIAVDTREQRPYKFPGYKTIMSTLPTGDYSIDGLLSKIVIERKTKGDMYSCIGQHRDRFVREMIRMQGYSYAAIIIESSLEDFCFPPACCKVSVSSAVNSLIAWSIRYGVHVYWASSRVYAQQLTLRILEKYWSEYFWKEEKVKPSNRNIQSIK